MAKDSGKTTKPSKGSKIASAVGDAAGRGEAAGSGHASEFDSRAVQRGNNCTRCLGVFVHSKTGGLESVNQHVGIDGSKASKKARLCCIQHRQALHETSVNYC